MKRLIRRKGSPAIVPATGWSAALVGLTAAVMTFLAVLTLAAGMAADRLAREWRADLTGIATVRITGAEETRASDIAAIVEILRTTPGIAEVRVLSDAEQQALLTPWLGTGVDLADLPTPQLVDVVLDGSGPDPARLQQRIDLAGLAAVYDDHAAWREPLARAARALERLALVATALTMLAASAMIAFAARMTLSANREVVTVVRLIGGEDRYIANAFVTRLSLRAWTGAVLGAGAAVLAVWLMPRLDAEAGLDISLAPEPIGWVVLLVAVPLAAGLVAWATARVTVRMTLARLG